METFNLLFTTFAQRWNLCGKFIEIACDNIGMQGKFTIIRASIHLFFYFSLLQKQFEIFVLSIVYICLVKNLRIWKQWMQKKRRVEKMDFHESLSYTYFESLVVSCIFISEFYILYVNMWYDKLHACRTVSICIWLYKHNK